MNTCSTCKFWSTMLATTETEIDGEVKAFCLCPDERFLYHAGSHTCKNYRFGASVDNPNIHEYEESDYAT